MNPRRYFVLAENAFSNDASGDPTSARLEQASRRLLIKSGSEPISDPPSKAPQPVQRGSFAQIGLVLGAISGMLLTFIDVNTQMQGLDGRDGLILGMALLGALLGFWTRLFSGSVGSVVGQNQLE